MCEDCPTGAFCTLPIPTYSTLRPQIEFRALSWNNHTFGKCPILNSCNSDNELDITGCHDGHDPISELCSECLPTFASQGKGDVCMKCPEKSETTSLFTGAVLLAVLVFSFLVYDNLDGARDMIPTSDDVDEDAARFGLRIVDQAATKMPFHSIVIRIVSSYLQMAGVLLQFDLQLPGSVKTLIVVEASTSSLSEQLLLFDCGTDIRNVHDLFLLKQLASVWIIPMLSIVVCGIAWIILKATCLRKNKEISVMDGFVSSLMVLFYTLFPSVVNRIALTFSCRSYGENEFQKSLLTEALSVKCWEPRHWAIISTIGIPGVLVYVILIPVLIALYLIKQRKLERLYPDQDEYDSHYTLRFGFMFAGYEKGYEWWESIVMLRKCCFVLLAIFLRQYGAAPQVVAASLVLVVALSAQLQNLPYMDQNHDRLETLGIQMCLLQLLVALLCNLLTQKDEMEGGTLGKTETVILIITVFGSTFLFFTTTVIATIHGSQDTKGAVGVLANTINDQCLNRCNRKSKLTMQWGDSEEEYVEEDENEDENEEQLCKKKVKVISAEIRVQAIKTVGKMKWQTMTWTERFETIEETIQYRNQQKKKKQRNKNNVVVPINTNSSTTLFSRAIITKVVNNDISNHILEDATTAALHHKEKVKKRKTDASQRLQVRLSKRGPRAPKISIKVLPSRSGEAMSRKDKIQQMIEMRKKINYMKQLHVKSFGDKKKKKKKQIELEATLKNDDNIGIEKEEKEEKEEKKKGIETVPLPPPRPVFSTLPEKEEEEEDDDDLADFASSEDDDDFADFA